MKRIACCAHRAPATISIWLLALLIAGSYTAAAIEPTELEPAESADAGRCELEIKGSYEDFNEGHETELEAELSYGINDHLRLGLNVPFEWEEDGEDGIGDVGAFLEWVANPESSGIVVGGEFKLTAPTGEDSDDVGGEVQLRFSKAFAEKHGLHLTLKGYYESEDEDDDHDYGYQAVLGYTFKPVESTTLIADIAVGEAPGEDEHSNLLEVGLTHEFNDTVEIGVGIGAGLDDDSPDFVAHAGIEFKFGGH
ncbi:MAG: transporter [Candidatus Hydrogenedentes bacterium]|nr:transporter [Candidatus Hydrogenedentota bacterium]